MSVTQITFTTDVLFRVQSGIYLVGDCTITVIRMSVFGMPDTTLIRVVAPTSAECLEGLKSILSGQESRTQMLSKAVTRSLVQEVFGYAAAFKIQEEGFEAAINKAIGFQSESGGGSTTIKDWQIADQLDSRERPE